MLDRLIRHGKDAIAAADRDAVINVMVARTNMNREQAAQTLQRWEEATRKPGLSSNRKPSRRRIQPRRPCRRLPCGRWWRWHSEALPRRLAGHVELHATSLPPLSGKHKT